MANDCYYHGYGTLSTGGRCAECVADDQKLLAQARGPRGSGCTLCSFRGRTVRHGLIPEVVPCPRCSRKPVRL